MSGRTGNQGTRDKILIAAATMLEEDPAARLSVRSVAARAGVSTGSLRHFFPTQRALLDTVIAGIYDVDIPHDPIHDTDKGPAERLIMCLQLLLSQVGTGDRAREHWRATYEAYVASSPTEDEAHAYLALERLGIHRIKRWLDVLVDEGALAVDDTERCARFLATVINGLFFERALPADHVRLVFEADTLRMAVDAIINDPDASTRPER